MESLWNAASPSVRPSDLCRVQRDPGVPGVNELTAKTRAATTIVTAEVRRRSANNWHLL